MNSFNERLRDKTALMELAYSDAGIALTEASKAPPCAGQDWMVPTLWPDQAAALLTALRANGYDVVKVEDRTQIKAEVFKWKSDIYRTNIEVRFKPAIEEVFSCRKSFDDYKLGAMLQDNYAARCMVDDMSRSYARKVMEQAIPKIEPLLRKVRVIDPATGKPIV